MSPNDERPVGGATERSGTEHGKNGAATVAQLLGRLYLPPRSSPKGKISAQHGTVAAPLTDDDLRAHLAGRERFGAIPFITPGTVIWSAIDWDAKAFALADGPPTPLPDDDPWHPALVRAVQSLIEELALRDVRVVLEMSKGKGWHGWSSYTAPVSARAVRRFFLPLIRKALEEAGLRPIEEYPKSSGNFRFADDLPTDIVCPRGDTAPNIGNGTWLPLFGGDTAGRTRFWIGDPESGQVVEAPDQAAELARLLDDPTAASAIGLVDQPDHDPPERREDHGCAWIADTLDEVGLPLGPEAHFTGEPPHEKIAFACPFHTAKVKRRRGGSAYFRANARGECSACGTQWRNLREYIVQLGGTPPEPQGHPSSGPSLRTQRFDAAQQPPNWIFETTPAPRRWLWEGFWPDQVGGIIASVGGGGKSRLLLQLMIRLAAGLPFGPYECCGPRGVVSVMLEDGLAEFHRRLLWDLHAMFPEGVPDAVRAAVLANIRPYDLQGVLGVDIGDGLIDQVAKIAATTRDPCGLVIFDPASLLMPRGVSLKDESASVMVSANNAVVEMTGAASSMVMHLPKWASREGEELRAEAVYGWAGLKDLSRWVLNLAQMSGDEGAKKYNLPRDGDYIEALITKSNYQARMRKPLVFSRDTTGGLHFIHTEATASVQQQRALDLLIGIGRPATVDEWDQARKDSDSQLAVNQLKSARVALLADGRVVLWGSEKRKKLGRAKQLYGPRPDLRPPGWGAAMQLKLVKDDDDADA
jgi:hypothetical protein